MKKNILLLLTLIAVNSNAQELRPFVGIGAHVHLYSFEKDLQSSPAINFSAGTEYKLFDFLLPEVEVNYMFGDYKDRSEIKTSDRTFSTVNFGFCPKIVLGDSNDSAYFQILPKYMYSLIEVTQTTTSTGIIVLEKQKSLSVSQHNFGLGIGVVLKFDTWYSNSFAFNLCYDSIRVSEPFDRLSPGTGRTDNIGVYGIDLKYYFGVKRLK